MLRRTLSTFANQTKLPRLPIVSLQVTTDRYLRSCRPLLSTEEFTHTSAVVAKFIQAGGEGEKLQHRLVGYDNTQVDFNTNDCC